MISIVRNCFYWVALPGIFVLAIYLDDHQLALVGATFLIAIGLIGGPIALLVLVGMMATKPTDSKWEENKAAALKLKASILTRVMSWVFLVITVGLCAYTGFVITAVFYLLSQLWVKLAREFSIKHFEKVE